MPSMIPCGLHVPDIQTARPVDLCPYITVAQASRVSQSLTPIREMT